MARARSAAGQPAGPLWSIPVPVEEIPETGRQLEAAADAATRGAVAKAAGIVAMPRLEVAVELTRHGRDGVRVVGQVAATVEQNCIVSLEPLQSEIVEPLDLVFVTAGADAVADEPLDPGTEPPEPLRGGVIDIGALAAEHVILGIDPYPRKPGVEFAPPTADDAGNRPFAVLAALKPKS